MADRIHSITVVLTDDMREDDADILCSAILQLKGVLSVSNNVSNLDSHVAREREKSALLKQLEYYRACLMRWPGGANDGKA